MTDGREAKWIFGEFELDAARRSLTRAGEPVALSGRAFGILQALVENRDRILTKDELLEKVWEGQIVEENNLTVHMAALRKALGEKKGEHRFVATVAGEGYRFVGEVAEREDTPLEIVVENRTVERVTIDEMDVPRGASWRPSRLAFAGAFAAVLLLVFGGLVFWLRRPATRPAESIAVMPFVYVGPDAADAEYLADGMTESLINNLSQLPKMTVKARSSVFHYKGREFDVPQVGRELSVEAVLLGRIVDRGDTFVISLELVDASNGNQIWGETYARPKSALATVQADLARDVASKLRSRLQTGDALARGQTSNAEAYELYLKGRYLWNNRKQSDHEKAIAMFERAIAIDPNFALAYAGLGDVYTVDSYRTTSYAEKTRRGREAAAKALALSPDLPEALTVMAKIEWNEWNWAESERNFRRALEINPNYASAHQWFAEMLMRLGRRDESLAEIRRAIELDPLSRVINSDSIYLHSMAKQYEKAVEQGTKTLEIDSKWSLAYLQRVFANEYLHRYGAAIDDIEKATMYAELPEDLKAQRLADVKELRGYLERDPELGYWAGLIEIEKRLPPEKWDCQLFSTSYMNLGEPDKALSSLEKCFEDEYYPEKGLDLINVDPTYEPLHGHPRFNAMLKKMNLEPR